MRSRDALRTPHAASGGFAGAADEPGATIYDIVRDLRRDAVDVEFPLDIAGATKAAQSRDRLVTQLDKHLLPRLKELSSPAVVVIAGSTGAGKSTLYNSILGEEVSAAGVLRPTTREPVLAYNPADADVLKSDAITALSRVIEHHGVPRGTALLDAPDLDSVLAENRDTAGLLLEAADLWLFVTTAARYGDALPWATLTQAVERGVSVAMVLNRVPRETLVMIRADLLARLREHSMDAVPLFVVPDVGPHEGMLNRKDVAPIERWLAMLAGPDRSRSVVVRTLKGSMDALPNWVHSLVSAVTAQIAAAQAIREAVQGALPAAQAAARESVITGNAAAGPLAATWAHVVADQRLDHLKVRGGIARSTRRRGRSRETALTDVRAQALGAAGRTLFAGASAGGQVLRAALTGDHAPQGGAGLVPEDEHQTRMRQNAVDQAVEQWAQVADDAASWHDAADASAQSKGAVKALGVNGIAALLLAAGAGNDDAARMVTTVLGSTGDTQTAALRADLASHAESLTGAEADPIMRFLDTPALAPDANVGLQLRLAELRRMT